MQSQTTTQCALFEALRSRQFLFMMPRAVSLQVMHPAISAALLEHSPSPGFIWLHKRDSVPATIQMAFEPGRRSGCRIGSSPAMGTFAERTPRGTATTP
ncbi:MAG TPA: hypothetical protein H9878_08105 [Candidatus Dietzia merdigallinarum]|nr:hypothetical protein [Candidatus Dietzia merdigallinarum]